MYARLHLQNTRCKANYAKRILQNLLAIVGTVLESPRTEIYLHGTNIVNLILQQRFFANLQYAKSVCRMSSIPTECEKWLS